MRIVTRKRLRAFWEQPNRRDAEGPLKAWFAETERAIWKTPGDVKDAHQNASILKGSRVVFNIAGNKYRLIVAVDYEKGFVLIKFIGTHQEYDAIDAETYGYGEGA